MRQPKYDYFQGHAAKVTVMPKTTFSFLEHNSQYHRAFVSSILDAK